MELCAEYFHLLYVTGFGKTLCMGFFLKIEFDVWLISSTIELTRIHVLGQSHASLRRYSALFTIAPHPQYSRNYGVTADLFRLAKLLRGNLYASGIVPIF